jgi:hypothetical protein
MAKGGAAQAQLAAGMQQNLLNSINATGKFQANLRTVQTSTESFSRALQANKLSMGEYFRYAGGASKTFGRMFTSEFNTMNKVARERVKDLQTQYIKMGRDANGAMKAIAVRPLTLDMENLATKTAIAAQKQQLLNQLLKQGSTNLLNWGKNTQWAGRQLMVGFTVPLLMLGSAAAKTYMALETASLKLRRVYGDLSTSEAETRKIAENIKQIGTEFTQYGIQVADTMELAATIAATGKQGQELLTQVRETSRMAALGGIDQNKALETTISLTNAFGIASKDLAENINFLNFTQNQTILSLDDMTEAIPRAAPIVQQLGGDVKDLAFFLTAMKEGGINAAQGANALKSGLASIINPSKAATEFLAKFNINLNGIVTGNKGNIKNTVVELGNALNKLDPLNRAQAIEKLFGKFQFSRISALLKNVTDANSQAATVTEIGQKSKAELSILAERELKRVSDSPMMKFQKAVAELKVTLVPLGEQFVKAVTPIAKFLTEALANFNKMDDGFKSFLTNMTIGVAGFGPVVLMVVGLVANGIANIIKLFVSVKSFFNNLGKSNKALGEQTNYLTEAQLNEKAVAASLDQVHNKLKQTFTSEAEAVGLLIGAYRRATVAQRAFMGAGVPRGPIGTRLASGGIVRGPGTGTSDEIPAMLSNGEAVIPAASVARNPALVASLISGNIAKYSIGGYVSSLGRNPNAPSAEIARTDAIQMGHLRDGVKMTIAEIIQSVEVLGEKAVSEIRTKLALEEKRMRAAGANPATTKLTAFTEAVIRQPQAINNLGNKAFDASVAKKAYVGTGGEIYDNYARHMQNAGMSAEGIKKVLDRAAAEMQISLGALDDKAQLTVVDLGKMAESALEVAVSGDSLSKQEQIAKQTIARVSQTRMSWTEFGTTNNRKGMRDSYKFNAEKNEKIATQIFGPKAAYGAGTGKARPDVDMMARNGVQYSPRAVTQSLSNLQFLGGKYEAAANDLISELNRTKKSPAEFRAAIQKLDRTLMEASDGAFNLAKMENELAAKMKQRTVTTQSGKSSQAVATEKAFGIQSPSKEEIKIATDRVAGFKQGMQTAVKQESQSGRALGKSSGEAFGLAAKTAVVASSKQMPRFFGPQPGMVINTSNAQNYVKPVPTAFQTAMAGAKTNFSREMGWVKQEFQQIITPIKTALQAAKGQVRSDAIFVEGSIKKALRTAVPESSLMGQAFKKLSSTMSVAKTNFSREWQWIKEDFLGGAKKMKAGAVDLEAEMTRMGKIFGTTSRIAQAALARGDMSAVLTKKAMSALSSAMPQTVVAAQKSAWASLIASMKAASNSVKEFGVNAATSAKKAATGTKTAFVSASTATATAMKQAWYRVNPTAGLRSELAAKIALAKGQKETIAQTITETRLKTEESKAIVAAVAAEKKITEARIAEIQAMLRGDAGIKKSASTRGNFLGSMFDNEKGGKGKMGAGMALSMLPMAMSMSGDKKMQDIGNQMMMPAMAASTALMMIPGPAGWVVAGLIGLATVVTMVIDMMNKAKEAGIKMANSMTMTDGKLVELSKVYKTVSATEEATRNRKDLNSGILSSKKDNGIATQMLNNTSFGKSLVAGIKTQQASGATDSDIGSNIATQLSTAMLEGVITDAQAKAIAKGLGDKLKNYKISAEIIGNLNQIVGPNGEALTANPGQVASEITRRGAEQTSNMFAMAQQKNAELSQQSALNTGQSVTMGVGAVAAGLGAAAAVTGATGVGIPVAAVLAGLAGVVLAVGAVANGFEAAANEAEKLQYRTAAVQLAANQVKSNQQMLDSLNAQFDKLKQIHNTEADINKLEAMRVKAIDEQTAASDQFYNSLAANYNTDGAGFKDSIAASIDTLYKDNAGMKTLADAALANVETNVKDTKMKVTLETALAAGTSPSTVDMLTKIVSKDAATSKNVQLAFSAKGNAEVDNLVNMLGSSGATQDTVTKTINLAMQNKGADWNNVKDAIVQINTLKNTYGVKIDINSANLAQISKDLGLINKLKSPITKKVVSTILETDAGKNNQTLQTLNDNWSKIVGSKSSVSKTVIMNVIAMGEQAVLDAYMGSIGAEGARYTAGALATGGKDVKNQIVVAAYKQQIAAQAEVERLLKAAGVLDTGTPSSPSGSGDKATNLFTQVNKGILDNTLEGTLRAKGYAKDFVSMITSADVLTQKLYTTIGKDGVRVLNANGIKLAAAYDKEILGDFTNKVAETAAALKLEGDMRTDLIAKGWSYAEASKAAADADYQGAYAAILRTKTGQAQAIALADLKTKWDAATAAQEKNTLQKTVGDFMTKQSQGLVDVKNQTAAITKLVAAGTTYSDALELVKDTTLANAIANSSNNDELKAAIKLYNELKKALEGAKTPAEKFQEAFDKAALQLDNEKNKKELEFKLDPAVIAANATIASANDSIAKNQYVLDQYNAGLTKISQQEDLINKKYEDRAAALEKVSVINQQIAEQEKGKISLAEALAKGDISAAAKAMADIRARNAQYAIDNKKKALEDAKQKELDSVTVLVNGKSMTRKQIEDQVKVLENDILDIQQKQLAPATELVRLKQVQLDKDIVLIDLEKSRWDRLNTQINDAKNGVYDYTKALIAAQDLANNAYKQYLNPNAVPGSTPPAATTTTTPPATTTTTTTTAELRAPYTYDPTRQAVVQTGQARVVTWVAYSPDGGVTFYDKAKGGNLVKLSGSSISPTVVTPPPPPKTPKTPPPELSMLPRRTLEAMGYFADGGFAKGTDTIPAMLTPGEFIVRKYAVDNFGVDNLKAINNGTYNGESVYNYNLSVSLNGSNMNANDVADVVMSKIKQIDSQRIRGNRL